MRSTSLRRRKPRGWVSGIAETGKEIEVHDGQIGRVEDGQIVERWGSSDELGILSQLDVDPTRVGK